jgi:transcription elongation factor Elf1
LDEGCRAWDPDGMQIVKPGRSSPEWSREFTCEPCGAVVEVERADLYVVLEHDIYGRRNILRATCGACGQPFTVEDPVRPGWGDDLSKWVAGTGR